MFVDLQEGGNREKRNETKKIENHIGINVIIYFGHKCTFKFHILLTHGYCRRKGKLKKQKKLI